MSYNCKGETVNNEGNGTSKIKFNAYVLFFVVCNLQIGVGIFSFPRYILTGAGHDAWITVILIGVAVHVILWAMIKTLEMHESLDLYGIHHAMFGKWFGGVLSIIIIVHYFMNIAIIVRTYIEAVQVWIFPDFPAWLLSLLLLFLVMYTVLGGIRVIFQVSLFGFLIIIITSLLFYYPLKYADWTHILPIYDTQVHHLVKSMLNMSFTVSGFEAIYFIYRYVKDKNKVMFYTQASVLFTNILYLIVMVVAIVYFSKNQLMHTTWGFINLLKIIKYPFLERIEFIILPCWMFVTLEGVILFTWILLRGTVYCFGWNGKLTLYGLAVMVLIASSCIQNQSQVFKLNNYISYSTVALVFVYPLLLFGMSHAVAWRHKVKGRDKC